MPVVTLQIPTGLATHVHGSLVALYAVSADALHHEAQAYAAGANMVEEVLRRRAELAALDDLLGRFGWLLGEPAREVTLAADSRLLRDALHGAVLDAADEVDAAAEATSPETLRSTGFSAASTS